MLEQSAPRRPRRLLLTAAGLAVALVAVGAPLLVLLLPHSAPAPIVQEACQVGTLMRPLAEEPPNAYVLPYGKVRSCRLLKARAYRLNAVDVRTLLLLDTERGAVAMRTEYRAVGHRYMTVDAFEIGAGDLPDELTPAEVERVRAGIRDRGGVRGKPWILVYGDG